MNNEKVRIRVMTKADCDRVGALQEKCLSNPWPADSLREMFSALGYMNLVATSDGELAGYAGLRGVLDEADIVNVAVAPEARRRGIGLRLVRGLLAAAKDEGIRTVYLDVRSSNDAAIRLYQKCGFVVCGRRKRFYKNPEEDAILMERHLPSDTHLIQ